jgi:Holliday junction DNA helicase RuvB
MRQPSDFHGFIGQTTTVRFLRQQLWGAQALGHPCPHLLVVGASGMGKTKLAHSLATEYGTECHVILGKAKPSKLCESLIRLSKGDFLFLDEAHNLPRDSQEALFEVIDSGRLTDRVEDQHHPAPERRQDGKLLIEPVTIVLATDQPGLLVNALQKRMELRIALNDYPLQDLKEIAANRATEIGLLLSPQAMQFVAKASQGQPRRAEQLLQGLRRHFATQSSRQLSVEDVRSYLVKAGMDEAGLDRLQVRWLRELGRRCHASLETLANLLGVDAIFARSQIEPGLIKLGYVHIGRTGRCLTKVVAVKADRREWLLWAKNVGLHEDVLGFVSHDPRIFDDAVDSNPRSWKAVSDLLLVSDGVPKSTLEAAIAGTVGNQRALTFCNFRKHGTEELPESRELLSNYGAHRNRVKAYVNEGRTDILNRAVYSLELCLQPRESYAAVRKDKDQWQNLGRFLNDLPPDLANGVREFLEEDGRDVPKRKSSP